MIQSLPFGSSQTASNHLTTDTATVLVKSFRSGDENLTFNLKRESGVWKIDDIGSQTEASLHAYLVKTSHEN
jgi:hypothetical protein